MEFAGSGGISAARIGAAFAIAVCIAGCSLFHHGDPPQQQFLDALGRGGGPEASQIWLHMSAEDRANLGHSMGITPESSPAQIQTQLMRHAREKADQEAGSGETSQGLSNDIQEGDINSQMIEMPGAGADQSSGLQNLPNLPSMIESAPDQPSPQEIR
jgi:hypothetical protein